MTDAIKALCNAQMAMGAVVKNAKNPHLKSKYADLGSVMDACFDALHANGFAVMQPGGQDEYGPFVETVFAHETGEMFRSKVYLLIGKPDMQGVGSAWTYARRYGLLGMAGLAPEDDDGEGTKRPPQERPAPTKPAEKTPAGPETKRDWVLDNITKAGTQQQLKAWWDKDTVSAVIDALPEPMSLQVTAAYTAAYDKLPADPAMQHPGGAG